ncbi:MAG: SpaA isopeptide-forming pilin-related protein, partial [Clostridiales bacterium]
RLFADNIEVPQSAIVLSAEQQWTHTWNNLPVKNNYGNKIVYRVSQDPLPYVTSEREYLDYIQSVWIPTDIMTNGENYLLADGGNTAINFAMGFNGNPQNIAAVRLSRTSAFINGERVNAVSTPEKAQQWLALKDTASQDGFYLQNSNFYLCQNKDGAGLPTSLGINSQKQTLFTYTAAKTLASDAGTWVRRIGSSYTSTVDAAQASQLTLYRQVPVDQNIKIINNYQPPNPSDGGKVDYHKRIDFLGDKVSNADTNLSGKDDYRLYLDVASGIKMPADLVLVLDVSGSMDTAKMQILNNALMGTDGFISRFLNADSRNHLSIVYFWGAKMPNPKCASKWATDNPIVNGVIKADQDVGDATIYQNWMTVANLSSLPQPLRKGVGGTNYGAGLYQAQQLLNRRPSNPSSTKYMVFMSDGVPTHALSTRNEYQVASNFQNMIVVFGQNNEYVPTNLYNSTGIYRYGSGEGTGEGGNFNINFCQKANKVLAKNFAVSNPDLHIFAVGVDDANPEVLQNLASGNGRYLNAQNFANLDATFASILGPRNVVISDSISEYVDLAGTANSTNLGLKLTSQSSTVKKTLWNNGLVTSDGMGIIQSVEVDPLTKKVTAIFEPTFTLAPNTVYTLSFNIRVNQKAYDDYGAYGYLVNGEADTDYGANNTSSDHPGFYSNDNPQATLSYQFGILGNLITKNYQKPVVQVSASEANLNILKTDDSLQKLPLAGAEFQLFKADYNGANQSWIKGDPIMGNAVTDINGKAAFTSIPPGHYFLVENKPPPGYQPAQGDILIYLDGERSAVIQGNEQAKLSKIGTAIWQIEISNAQYISLPDTGGRGTQLFSFWGSGLLFLAMAISIIYLSYYKCGKRGNKLL